MNATELLSECRSKDITLKLADGQLRYKAPKGTMSDELKGALREHKQTLIELLQPADYYHEHIRAVIAEFNSCGIRMMDIPEPMRRKALRLEEEMTQLANRDDRDKFLQALKQWRACFH